MKKVLSILTLGVVAVASSYAQGTVGFNNGTSSKISVNSSIGGTSFASTAATANAYYYALFYSINSTTVNGSSAAVVGGPSADSTSSFVLGDSTWTYAPGTLGASIATAGRFASTTADANGNTAVTGVAGGGVAQFVVIGWSANIGSTESALASFLAGDSTPGLIGAVGQSIPSGPITTGAGVGLPPGLFGAVGTPNVINGFSLGQIEPVPTPEPTSIALGVMGGLSLLALRRKKA
jgi:hypothetical protein